MLLPFWPSLVAALITIALALGAIVARALTPAAGTVAAAFGIVIVLAAGYGYLALLILFVVGSVLATRFRIAEKRRQNVQEGTAGERGVSNVLAHILLPTALAVGVVLVPGHADSFAVLFASALAFGASDTFASEMGVLSGTARSLLTGRPVRPGTNGGVSAVGEGWAFVGALSIGALGALLFRLFATPSPSAAFLVGVATAAGFLGCQVDSLLGELLENRGYLTKGSTNFLGMLAAVAIAAACVAAVGGGL
ncbi:membrane protein containing DUF92, transmembrane [mine drainage metagenome]|uniref:Membrane protein containing DUF92, transmembrane n=2 Tax=mine drainage metagenome TaxID=410659 RepID=T1AEN2_9ZZZZ